MSSNPYINRQVRDPAPTKEQMKFFVEVTQGAIEAGDWLAGNDQWAFGAIGSHIDRYPVYKPVMRYMPPPEV